MPRLQVAGTKENNRRREDVSTCLQRRLEGFRVVKSRTMALGYQDTGPGTKLYGGRINAWVPNYLAGVCAFRANV